MRGDEPEMSDACHKVYEMYPTCVGMNRDFEGLNTKAYNVPHMRGDEPLAAELVKDLDKCTPHAWG